MTRIERRQKLDYGQKTNSTTKDSYVYVMGHRYCNGSNVHAWVKEARETNPEGKLNLQKSKELFKRIIGRKVNVY